MNKITVLGLISERENLLEDLQKFGVVDITQEDPSEELADKARRPEVQSELYSIDGTLSELSRSLEILNRYVTVKKPLFSARKVISEADYNAVISKKDEILNIVSRINRFEDEIGRLKSEENRLVSAIASLTPWMEMDIPLDVTGTCSTACFTGSLPVTRDLEADERALFEACPEAVMLKGISNRDSHYVAFIVHQSGEAVVNSLLRDWGFNKITLRDVTGTARESKAHLEKRLDAVRQERDDKLAAIKDLARERERLEILSDGYRMERARIDAKSRLVSTRSAFLLKGWLPAELSEKVKDFISKKYFCSVEVNESEPDEAYPVMIKNGPVVESIEPVLTMYGVPSSGEIDPSPVMMPFFIFFFGMMLSDGGYGLILALASAFILKKFTLEDSTKKFIKLIFFCGLSSMFAGLLFGSWFGISSLTKTALWIVPTENPELMLSWAMLFGIIHMYVGLFMKALNLIKRKKVLDAILDTVPFYVMFTGFVLTLLPFAPGIDSSGLGQLIKTGNYLLVAGVVLVLATQGRHSKSIFGKIFGGVGKLYDLVGFFGDTLSYTRLVALGLASAIIGDIVNTMSNFGSIVVTIIAGGLVIIIGHTINLGLNVLGAFVHSCRLQYLEFFGKFLEGGGEAFKPYKANTKYIIVESETSKYLQSGVNTGIV